MHNPWGVHAREGETRYEIWATETGSVESTLAVDRDAGVCEGEVRMRFARQLERFLAQKDLPPRLWESTVMLRLGFEADSETGPGYGRLNAPEHLCRTLGVFVELALDEMSRRPERQIWPRQAIAATSRNSQRVIDAATGESESGPN